MKKTLTGCGFVMASLAMIILFVSATTYIQLVVAILLYPLLAFLVYKAFPDLTRDVPSKKPVTTVRPTILKSTEKAETGEKGKTGIIDIDKRTFLKLIGGAGLSLFLFALFNKRSENLFFKSLPGGSGSVSLEDAAGNKIDPAQRNPTDGYSISEIDDNIIAYFGFTNKDGAWFIMREDAETGAIRYTKADSNFPGNWSNRGNLKYDYFGNIF